MKIYRASHYLIGIEEVESQAETDKFYIIDGRKYAKVSNYESYHTSRDNAKEKLIEIVNSDINKLEWQLDQKKRLFGKVLEL